MTGEPDCPGIKDVRMVSFIYCDRCGGNRVGIQTVVNRGNRGKTTQCIWCMDCRVILGGQT